MLLSAVDGAIHAAAGPNLKAFLSTLVIYFELVHVQLSNMLICRFVAMNMEHCS
jgi:hypothetical protein